MRGTYLKKLTLREMIELNGGRPKNHIDEQKEYIKRLEEKNRKANEIKQMQPGMSNLP